MATGCLGATPHRAAEKKETPSKRNFGPELTGRCALGQRRGAHSPTNSSALRGSTPAARMQSPHVAMWGPFCQSAAWGDTQGSPEVACSSHSRRREARWMDVSCAGCLSQQRTRGWTGWIGPNGKKLTPAQTQGVDKTSCKAKRSLHLAARGGGGGHGALIPDCWCPCSKRE